MIHLNRALQRGMRLHRRPSNQVSELVVRMLTQAEEAANWKKRYEAGQQLLESQEGERAEQARTLRVRIAELEKELLEAKVAEEYFRGKVSKLHLQLSRAKAKNKDKARVRR